MNVIFDIEIILNKQKYHPIYNIGTILIFIFLIFIYVVSIYKYQTYYQTKGKIKDNCLELMVNIEDIKYLTNQNNLIINNKVYQYNIQSISDNLYVDENYHNYQSLCLEVEQLNKINNYVYNVKIKKENKKIIEYLRDYL